MARQRSRIKAQLPLQPEERNHDGSGDDASEKDATETELEKLVFGDKSGFREGIRSHKRYSSELTFEDNDNPEDEPYASEDERASGDDKGLEGVDDADVGIRY